MPKFIPGLQLSELFFKEAVKPVLSKHFSSLKYSAALLGYGSDVIGFDTPRSTDHMWGPRLYLFLPDQDYQVSRSDIPEYLKHELPYSFKGYSVNFSTPDMNDGGVQHPEPIESGPVNPLIRIHTIRSFFEAYLNHNPADDIDHPSWLTFPEHRLLAATAGRVFHDELGLAAVREKFSYYPDEVWYYLLASQWARISQEEAFVGRCGEVGDALGSQIVAAQLVRSLMRLCFLMEKQYAPYSKWFGSAFARLPISTGLAEVLDGVLKATTWPDREACLSQAYEIVAKHHNSLGITEPLNERVTTYFGRPYQVIFASRFADAIRALITDEDIKKIEANIGSVSQFSDTPDVYDNLGVCERLKMLYKPQ